MVNKATFTLRYYTVWGENLILESGCGRYPMKYTTDGIWTVTLCNVPEQLFSDFRYCVEKDGCIVRTEWKHHCCAPSKTVDEAWIDCDIPGCPFNRSHTFTAFDSPGFRGAGVAVPVFSLRSSTSFGIGEFADIRLLADWAHSAGMVLIQLLPVNDTVRTHTWLDSYPYNPISSFALHPQYINLEKTGVRLSARDIALRNELNSLVSVDYERVNNAKERILRRQYRKQGHSDICSDEYLAFYGKNRYWLDEYAAYCCRRDCSEDSGYYCWVQYHLDRQLSEVCGYALSKGIALKGDLPIGVSRDSVEAVNHPELFNLDFQTGAPPDAFSDDGQNWGFPTYNWEEMARDGYAWWKSRLRKMAEYFNAYRIDHILGFFRIWEIPIGAVSGAMGHFYPALPFDGSVIVGAGLPFKGLFLEDPRMHGYWHPQIIPDRKVLDSLDEIRRTRYDEMYRDFFYRSNNSFWKRNAMLKLPALICSTGMLACGEDLGMIPDCVPEVMKSECILSLEMQRMPKETGVEWGNPAGYPYLSVCATSSHDMSPIRLWWTDEMDAQMRERYWHTVLGCTGPAPCEATPELCTLILKQHLASPSMLAVFPIQDWTAADASVRSSEPENERINVPSNPRNYWRYRMHIPLEDLISNKHFNDGILRMVKESGR